MSVEIGAGQEPTPVGPRLVERGGRFGRSAAVLALQRYGIVMALIAMGIYFSFRTSTFYSVDNLLQILRQGSINAIVALGITFVIISAGIDLSVGSTAGLAGMVTAKAMKGGLFGIDVRWQAAILVGLAIGLLVGLTNGLLITWLRITPFIVTLGMLSVARGVTFIYSNGRPVYGMPAAFNRYVAADIGRVPIPVLIAGGLAVLAWLVLRYTRLGEYTYAIGGNEEATRLSGVDVDRYKVAIYMVCGLFAAAAGVVLTARVFSAAPDAATGYELNAIAATVMGGTSLFGGEGGVVGTIIGALIIATLLNGLTLLDVQAFYQQLAIGVVIILAVALDRFRQ